jgi:predicted porin
MKKSLLALAVLGAFAGAASAQSSVTLYGKIDLGGVYDSGAIGTNAKSVRLSSGVSGGSRLGFKGVEDLGGGLKASFQLETGFCADSNAGAPNFCTGGNNFMGRQAHVDLSGGFGTVALGRQYTPGFLVVTTVDPFGTGLAGQTTNLFDEAGGAKGNPRFNNAVVYTTPNLGGFTASLAAAAGETTGNWKANRQFGGSASYAAGPLYVAASFHRVNDAGGATGKKDWNIGGVYDFGMLKAHALYQTTKNGQAPVAAKAAVTTVCSTGTCTLTPAVAAVNTSWTDAADYMLGVSVPFGQSTVLASYINHNDKTANNYDARQFGIGYYYALSKRTSLYSAYAHISNKNGAQYTVGNATEAGTGNAAFNLGIVHNF